MSKKLIGFINLTKCKEAKLFKTKAGDTCCNVVVWLNDEKDQYGNCASIQLQVEKDAPKVYVGSLKEPEAKKPEQQAPEQSKDNLPF